MHAHVQHQLAPALVLAFLRAEAVDQLAQHGELRLGQLALLGLLLRQHLAQLQVELSDLRQAAVAQFDGQQRATVERHLLQAGVHLVQALADRLAGLCAVALQGQQVVLALVLQQVEEALFVLWQAVAFQPFEACEEVLGRGHRHGEVARLSGHCWMKRRKQPISWFSMRLRSCCEDDNCSFSALLTWRMCASSVSRLSGPCSCRRSARPASCSWARLGSTSARLCWRARSRRSRS